MQKLNAEKVGMGIDREEERDATYTLRQRQRESDPLENDMYFVTFLIHPISDSRPVNLFIAPLN